MQWNTDLPYSWHYFLARQIALFETESYTLNNVLGFTNTKFTYRDAENDDEIAYCRYIHSG